MTFPDRLELLAPIAFLARLLRHSIYPFVTDVFIDATLESAIFALALTNVFYSQSSSFKLLEFKVAPIFEKYSMNKTDEQELTPLFQVTQPA